MANPWGLCILPSASNSNADPHLYFAEFGNNRIQVFNANTGAHVRYIANPGGNRNPHCVVVAKTLPMEARSFMLVFTQEQ